ncbi:MAG TPA: hypothetical protein DEF89_09495 [Desulfosporosinus sp.]|nr:MAG: hypothetical protein JL57_26225 [Desulfosporosinus sp. BICA1-9]HBW35554.1 hypothetical protein [Desulfosporosinus sp.]
MDLRHANFIKWVGHGQFPIKIEGRLLMTGVWMSFLPKVEMKTNKDPSCVPPELLREAFVLMAWS